jgi:lipoate-protein ligase A
LTFTLTGDDWDRIYQLCESKYKSWDWTFGSSPDFIVRQDFKYNGESFESAVHVSSGVIKKSTSAMGQADRPG